MIAGSDRLLARSAPDDYFDAARETGRRRAEQRLPLDDVLRSFRRGGRSATRLPARDLREPAVGLDCG